MIQLSALNPHKWSSENTERICMFARRYGIPEDAAQREYSLFRDSQVFASLLTDMEERKRRGLKNPFLPLMLKKFEESDIRNLYPNLYTILQIAATFPVTIASCERSHGKLKIINNYLLASMGEDRLENLVEISSEQDLSKTIPLSSLVDKFAIKTRKLPL